MLASSAAGAPDEDMAAAAAALDAAQDAIDELDDSSLRSMMLRSLQLAVAALQQPRIHRGQRPGMAHRGQWVEGLAANSELRPPRNAVFVAMVALFDLTWRPMTSTERSQRLRLDEEKRELEQDQNTHAHHVTRLHIIDHGVTWHRIVAGMQLRKVKEEHEAHDIAKHSAKWAEVCAVFATCGLDRLATLGVLKTLRADDILPSLYEPPSAIPLAFAEEAGSPRRGLLAAVTEYLNGESASGGHTTLAHAQPARPPTCAPPHTY